MSIIILIIDNSPLIKKPFQQNRTANNTDIIVDTDIHIVENVNTKNTKHVLHVYIDEK